MGLPQIVFGLVLLERLAELAYARRNTARLLAAGGIEHGRRHYPLFMLLHGGWLAALILMVPGDAPVAWPFLAAFVLLQGLRLWVIASLGRCWTTRVITLPGEPLRIAGPYRFLRHPNYLVVIGEFLVLPLAFGAWGIAIVFSALNLALLAYRVRIEDSALAPRRTG